MTNIIELADYRKRIVYPSKMPKDVQLACLDYIYQRTTDSDECILWARKVIHDGYGSATLEYLRDPVANRWIKDNMGVTYCIAAHRLSYLAHGEEITEDKPCVQHTCPNRHCVNPDHLRSASRKEITQNIDHKTANRDQRIRSSINYLLGMGMSPYRIFRATGVPLANVYKHALSPSYHHYTKD